jgi:Neuraminidase-like domain/FHA domain/Salmonella virulence plasmid 28.1kDa A protein
MVIGHTSGSRLVVTSPADVAGLVLPLSSPELIIGHSDTADLVLEDRFVSRRHALVTVDTSGAVTIWDLNSTGGTFVNDERLAGPRVLEPGDTVRFADLQARFEPGAAATTAAPTEQAPPANAGPGAENAAPDGGNRPESVFSGNLVYTVTGTVATPALPGVAGLTVQLVDKNVGADQLLGTTQTASDGGFGFASLAIPLKYLAGHHKTEPDLQVRVSAGQQFLAASEVVYSAPVTVTLNVVLPAGAPGLPSEYETLTANLAAAYPGRLATLQEGKGRSDVTYLANKTSWDARAVALAALADQFSEITVTAQPPLPGPGETAALPLPAVSLRAEFYYALFRAGLPASPDTLFQSGSGTVQAIWQQAIAQGVIPQALADDVPSAVRSYQALSAARVLTAAPAAGLSTLQEMLTATLPEPAQQREFAQLYTQHQDDWASFWPAAEQVFGTAATARLQLTGQLYYLTVNNEPLVSALLAAEARTPLASAQDLAARGYYTPDSWAPLVGSSVPPGIPGADADERAGNYAELLAAQVRIAFPTAVLADQVARGLVPVSGPAQTATEVAGFLSANQGQFEIGAEPVEAYLARTATTAPSATAITQIKRLQTASRLAQDGTSVGVLLRHNLDSAFAVTRYDAAGFTRAFADKLGGADAAAAIHARASGIFAVTLSTALSYLSGRVAPSLPVQYGYPPPSAAPSYPVVAAPTLEELFGSLDYCSCSDCSSILSPAAYLVDLLNFIDQPAPEAGFSNPQEVLTGRRPDLQYLPLTCANTNTALPYIDIVNETLEYFTAHGLSLDGYQGYDTPETVTSAELLASPQYVDDAAYAILQDAFFPPPLPFSRPLALLRLHLQNLGLVLPDAMATLRAGDQLVNRTTPTSFGWLDILIEQLTISRDEYRLFTDPGLLLGDLSGLPNATALADLQAMSLQELSRRLAVSYDDLSAIVQTRFTNPNAALIPRLQQLDAPFATLQVLHDTLNTPQSIAASFIAALRPGLDATQYGGAGPTDYQAVVDWVTGPAVYPLIMGIITISDPGGNGGDCSGASLQLRYANPDNTSNLLSGTDYLKLIRFIRLWRKLGPLLGDTSDTASIQHTDDILGALYPAADLPAGTSDAANDTANRPLLDAGFATLLPRLGFGVRVMNQLSLAGPAVDQLLACWAPIGPALYRGMFLTPTLLQQDRGALTATVGTGVNAGDVLLTAINLPSGQPGQLAYTVQPADTATTAATAIAAQLNASMAADPASGLPLNARFHATSSSSVITIKAGFTLACSVSAGASETYTAAAGPPLSRSATVGGSMTAGDTLTTTIDGVAIGYTVAAADTPATAAAGLADVINGTTIQDPYSGLPLNSLVAASSAGTVVTIVAAGAGAPFTLACTLTPANAGTYSAGPAAPAGQTATITGTVGAGDTLVTTINSVPISYSAQAADISAAALAASIAATISAAVQPDPATQLPLGSVVRARSTGGVITITAVDPATPFTLACSVTAGAESYTAAGPFAQTATATVAGTIPAGVTLTTTINGLPLVYQTALGQSPAAIAAAIAAVINATTSADADTGLPLNSVVSAVATGGAITVTAASMTASFTLTAALEAGGYTAGSQNPPFADDRYGDFLTDTTQTVFGHQPALCAAFSLTGTEFALITTALGFDASTPLILANVSVVFRYGWLAHTLGLSVLEFLRLREFTGLDPFAPLDPAPAAPAEPPVIGFVRLLSALAAAGMATTQALYLMWNQDLSGTSSPPPAVVTGLASALRADFAAVQAQFALQDDPDGSIAQNLMSLVYGSTASAFFFGLLNGTFTTSVPYSAPPGQSALPAPVIAASGGRLGYNDLSQQLSFAGVLDSAGQNAIDAVISVGTTDSEDNVPAGHAVSFTPASMASIYQGAALVIDTGAKQETVVVSRVTATSFTADTVQAHDGTSTPFPVSNDPGLPAAVASLEAASQQAIAPFFASYPELAPLYAAYVASADPVQVKRQTLLGSFLPALTVKRKQEQALAAVTSAAGTDPSFATALLQDPAILHADADATLPAVADLTAIETQGLTAEFYLGNDPAAAPDQVIDAAPALSYAAAGGNQLPPGPGGGPIAGSWSGYLTVPQDGPYDLRIAADPGAAITLEIAGAPVTLQQAAGLWQNQGPIALVAGALVSFTVTATSIQTTFSVSWQGLGLGWETIPGAYLYPASLTGHLSNTYIRFLKAVSLASALTLTAAETAYLGTASIISGQGWLNSLRAQGDPDPATAASLRDVLTDLTDFSRVKQALSPSDGRLLAVLRDPAAPAPGGQTALASLTGWSQASVNALLTQFFGGTDLGQLSSVGNFSRVFDAYALVRASRLAGAALISAITNAPSATTVSALQWALRTRYAEADWLTVIRPVNDAARILQRDALVAYILCKLGDGYAQSAVAVTLSTAAVAGATALTCAAVTGVTVGMLVQGAGIAPGTMVTAVAGTAITLSAGTLAALPAGTNLLAAPAGPAFDTPDSLYEHFLIDPQTQPAVQTSRIRLALSAVQLFVERVIRNLEPLASPADISAAQWQWMKRYRVWQANREVFLWPENWLYPELRDNQSPIFGQMMSSLLQGDITDDAAASAYLDYLTGLEEVAKLEPCGLYYQPGTAGTGETSYVVARTAGANRKYYFRQLTAGSWTPWSQVAIDCEDMPVTPIIWNGRLFLFWLKAVKQAQPSRTQLTASPNGAKTTFADLTVGDLNSFTGAAASSAQTGSVNIQAVLCWTEYYNGKWQPTKTSDVNHPTAIGQFDQTGPGAFESYRSSIRIVPAQLISPPQMMLRYHTEFTLPTGTLILDISVPGQSPDGGFVLHNTHSLPVRFEDVAFTVPIYFKGWLTNLVQYVWLTSVLRPPSPDRSFSSAAPYTGGYGSGTFGISYLTAQGSPATYVNNLLQYTWQPRAVQPEPWLPDEWDAPFLYEDRRHLFYVTTTESLVPIWRFSGFGILQASPGVLAAGLPVSPLVLRQPVTAATPPEVLALAAADGDPAAVQRFVSASSAIKAALALPLTVTYQGQLISPIGSVPAPPITERGSGGQ